jgi:hypothetical protein
MMDHLSRQGTLGHASAALSQQYYPQKSKGTYLYFTPSILVTDGLNATEVQAI